MSRIDIVLSAAALLLPAGAMVGTALALLRPAPPAHVGERLPVKEFTERFSAAFAVQQPPPAGPDEPAPPVPLPPERPPPEPLPEPWMTAAEASSSSPPVAGKLQFAVPRQAADICARHGGWRVDIGRGWRCAYRHAPATRHGAPMAAS